MSVYAGCIKSYSPLKRVRVTYEKEKSILYCDCCKQKIYCSHKIIARWYVYQYLPSLVKTNKTICEDRDEDGMDIDRDDEQQQSETDQQRSLTSNQAVEDASEYKHIPMKFRWLQDTWVLCYVEILVK